MRKGVWEWYLKQDGKEYGPLSHRELLLLAGLGKVRSQDRLWAPGFPNWVPADLIPGLLKPSFILSMLTLSRSWEAAFPRCRASWLRAQERAASLLHGFSTAIKLPAVWLGVGSVLVVIIIGTSTQNSEPSFAIGAPASSKAETSDCDPAAQVQARVPPIPLTPAAPMRKEVQASENDALAEATPIPLAPAALMHEEVQASENDEVAEATEPNANSTKEDAIPLPTRKPVVSRTTFKKYRYKRGSPIRSASPPGGSPWIFGG